MRLTLIEKRRETSDTTSFLFQSESPFSWRAGQFLRYTLEHPNPDERKTKRYFTIASAPHEGVVMLSTRFSNDGSSFKRALEALSIGGTIEAEGPDGDFVVEDPAAEHVFIAGGIGVTPYRAILLDLDHRNLPMNVKLLYANRNEEFVYKSLLEELTKKHPTFMIEYFVSPAKIDEKAIRGAVPDLQKPIFYVSGPEPMVEAFEKLLIEMGIPDPHIKRDYFPGYDWP